MKTVYSLIGEIGRDNLSTNAKNKLKKLNELDENLTNLQSALKTCEKGEEIMWTKKVEDAQTALDNFENDFAVFLEGELTDVQAKKEREKAKAQTQAQTVEPAPTVQPAQTVQPATTQPATAQPATTESKVVHTAEPVKPKKKNNGLAIVAGLVLATVLGVGATAFLRNK